MNPTASRIALAPRGYPVNRAKTPGSQRSRRPLPAERRGRYSSVIVIGMRIGDRWPPDKPDGVKWPEDTHRAPLAAVGPRGVASPASFLPDTLGHCRSVADRPGRRSGSALGSSWSGTSGSTGDQTQLIAGEVRRAPEDNSNFKGVNNWISGIFGRLEWAGARRATS